MRTFSLSLLLLPAALVAQAPSVDQLIAKSVQARGGLARLQAVQTMRITGKIMGGPQEIPLVIEFKRPGQVRVDVSIQGQTIVQAYDGKQAWSINPFAGYQGGKKDAQPMDPEQAQQLEQQADTDGPLVDYARKGHKVEYAGQESVEGSPAHKLKVTLKNGTLTTVFLDAETFLEVKAATKAKVRGTEVEGEVLFSDFKDVGGMTMFHAMEMKGKGTPAGQSQKMVFERIELNVPLDARRFVMPAPAPEPKADPKIDAKPKTDAKPAGK